MGYKNGLKHGIYSAGLSDEEKEISEAILLGNVDEEIRLVRIQLRRAVIAQRKFLDTPEDETVLTLSETTSELGSVPVPASDGQPATTTDVLRVVKKVRKMPDFDTIIHRYVGRVGELERIRSEIGGGQADYLAAARKIKDALTDIESSVPDPDAPPPDDDVFDEEDDGISEEDADAAVDEP